MSLTFRAQLEPKLITKKSLQDNENIINPSRVGGKNLTVKSLDTRNEESLTT